MCPGRQLADAAISLLTFVLPSPCVGCERPISEWRPLLGLCVTCRGRLVPLRDACPGCAQPLPSASRRSADLCLDCRREPRSFDRLTAAYLYEPPLDAVVRHLKFGGLAHLGSHAARLLVERHAPDLSQAEIVVPVPLHWRRALVRGYNQAEEISKPLARRLGLPHAGSLRRRRPTRPQATRTRRERRKGPRGAFVARRASAVAGRHVLLVDDVATSCATAEAASKALRRAGADPISVLVLARTPPPGAQGRPHWQGS